MPKNPESRKEHAEKLHFHAKILWEERKDFEDRMEIGIALKEIGDEGLFKELGYRNFGTYLKGGCPFSKTTAYTWIKIVEKLSVNSDLMEYLMPKKHLQGVLNEIGISLFPEIKFVKNRKETLCQKISRAVKNMLRNCTSSSPGRAIS